MCFQKDDWRICVLAIFNSKGRQVQYVCCQFSQITVLSRISILAIKSKAVFSIWPQRNCCVGIDCSLQWTEKRLQFRLRDYQKTFHIKSGKNISLKFKLHGLVGSSCSPRDSQESSPTPQFKSSNSLALSIAHQHNLHT